MKSVSWRSAYSVLFASDARERRQEIRKATAAKLSVNSWDGPSALPACVPQAMVPQETAPEVTMPVASGPRSTDVGCFYLELWSSPFDRSALSALGLKASLRK